VTYVYLVFWPSICAVSIETFIEDGFNGLCSWFLFEGILTLKGWEVFLVRNWVLYQAFKICMSLLEHYLVFLLFSIPLSGAQCELPQIKVVILCSVVYWEYWSVFWWGGRNMSHNRLQGPIPLSIGNLTALLTLYVSAFWHIWAIRFSRICTWI